MWLLILIPILLILYYLIFIRHKKSLQYGDMVLFTGGIKVGKTTLSVYTIKKEYSLRIAEWKKENRWNLIYNFFHKKTPRELTEKPLIYSTMPLSIPYVPLTKELILREKRYAKKSIVYINEASFVASQFDYNDDFINTCLTYHNKLIGHELQGGILIIDTQSVKDLHFSFKNCLSNYVWIHHKKSFFFFWLKLYVRELIYQDGDNSFNEDIEKTLLEIVIPKRIWKLFDCYAYSGFTDDKPLEDNIIIPSCDNDLKVKNILCLREYFKNMRKGGKK